MNSPPTFSVQAPATHADRLAAGLRRHGVTHLFAQSIPSTLMLAAPDHGIRQIGYRAENAGGVMADGFARVSHRIGVVCAQNGPAATLLVAPLAEALKASVPLLALVEEIPATDVERNAFQEFDHRALFQSCTKWSAKVESGDRLDDLLDLAMVTATSGRPGPVALFLPRDMMMAESHGEPERRANLGRYPLDRLRPDADSVVEAARLLLQAKRPLVMAGGGVHLSDAADALVRLCERWNLPVATTNMGKGAIDERHDLALGVFGNCMGQGTPAHALQAFAAQADVVLLVGTRTNQNGTDAWTLLPQGARCIHIDASAIEIGRNYEALRLTGDARTALTDLDAAMADAGDPAAFTARGKSVAAATGEARAVAAAEIDRIGLGERDAVRPEALMRALDSRLRPDDIVVADASYSTNWMNSFLTARRSGQRFLSPRGLAGLGWGLPMAMGAKIAEPGARVIAIVGDGGFGHCWAELETMRRMDIDVKLIVLSNAILGYQKHGESAFFGRYTDACDMTRVDHAALARLCGLDGFTLDDPAALGATLDQWLSAPAGALLDVITDPLAHPPLNQFAGRSTVAPLHAWQP